jgi:iron complex transport system ATP-binding protein
MTVLALKATGLCARLGSTEVLHDVSLELVAGRWISVVGPNGAGKSTLLKVLAGPTQRDHRAVEQALRATQSWDWRGRALGQLSAGERQRVLLARALAVQAEVLLMDEPLANLDPPHQADWLTLVRALVASGKTVVSVLHEISMALHADDMLILSAGRVLHLGASREARTQRALEQVFGNRIGVHTFFNQPVVLLKK